MPTAFCLRCSAATEIPPKVPEAEISVHLALKPLLNGEIEILLKTKPQDQRQHTTQNLTKKQQQKKQTLELAYQVLDKFAGRSHAFS